jgi:AmmeMemoRadiSam system protein B
MPHAGYRFSGRTAGAALADVAVPEVVLLLGPNHRGIGPELSSPRRGVWRMPGGDVAIDEELATRCAEALPDAQDDHRAHASEHALEVELPFLQEKRASMRIVPLLFGALTLEACRRCGEALARVVERDGRDTLLIASTDMSHHVPDEEARRQDGRAIDQMLARDGDGLYRTVREERISMCGVVPVTVTLHALRALGHAGEARIMDYRTSGDATGERGRVVGYLGMQIF